MPSDNTGEPLSFRYWTLHQLHKEMYMFYSTQKPLLFSIGWQNLYQLCTIVTKYRLSQPCPEFREFSDTMARVASVPENKVSNHHIWGETLGIQYINLPKDTHKYQ